MANNIVESNAEKISNYLSNPDNLRARSISSVLTTPVEIVRVPTFGRNELPQEIFITYESNSGLIRSPNFAEQKGSITLVQLALHNDKIVFDFDSGRLNQALTLLGYNVSDLIYHPEVEEIPAQKRIRCIPIRLDSIDEKNFAGTFPSEYIHVGEPSRWKSHDGDYVLLDSIVEYNTNHVHSR